MSGSFTAANINIQNIHVENLNTSNVGTSLIPSSTDVDLGRFDKPWKDLFVSSESIKYVSSEADSKVVSTSTINVGETEYIISADATSFGTTETTKTKIDGASIKFIEDGIATTDVLDKDWKTTTVEIAKAETAELVSKRRDANSFVYNCKLEYATNSSGEYILNDSKEYYPTRVLSGVVELGSDIPFIQRTENTANKNLNDNSKCITHNFFNNNLPEIVPIGLSHEFNLSISSLNKINLTEFKHDFLDDKQYIIPLDRNIKFKNLIPLTIFDINKKAGYMKFKNDLEYSIDLMKNGIKSLTGYVSLIHPMLSGFNILSSSLPSNSMVVEAIIYYDNPILSPMDPYRIEPNEIHYYRFLFHTDVTDRKNKKYYEKTSSVGFSQPTNTDSTDFPYPSITIKLWENNRFSGLTTEQHLTSFSDILKAYIKWYDSSSKTLTVDKVIAHFNDKSNSIVSNNWLFILLKLTYAFIKYGEATHELNTTEETNLKSKFETDDNAFVKENLIIKSSPMKLFYKKTFYDEI